MDLFRKIGIGIVSIIPAFVLGGLIWQWFGSWLAVLGMVIIVGIFSGSAIAGKFSREQG
ncbi:MAG: hypothetical protein K9N21_22200 [Deltaproteobacteria bacterium]|nr:hypothetical protein [Deltaproteobacteria bacterium]